MKLGRLSERRDDVPQSWVGQPERSLATQDADLAVALHHPTAAFPRHDQDDTRAGRVGALEKIVDRLMRVRNAAPVQVDTGVDLKPTA